MIAQEIKEVFPARTGTPEQIAAKQQLALGSIQLMEYAMQTYTTVEDVIPGSVTTDIERWRGFPPTSEAQQLKAAFYKVCQLHGATTSSLLDHKDETTTSNQEIILNFGGGLKRASFQRVVNYLKEEWT